jgi:hypothetical protein
MLGGEPKFRGETNDLMRRQCAGTQPELLSAAVSEWTQRQSCSVADDPTIRRISAAGNMFVRRQWINLQCL